MVTKVSLRQKKLSKGCKSLCLNFYQPTLNPEIVKPTRNEFLRLYFCEEPKTPIDKKNNTELLKIGEGYFLNFSQNKTKCAEVLPISGQAYRFTEVTEIGKGMPQDKPIFEGLRYLAYNNRLLFQWIGASGIIKDLTIHCFRLAFASLQLFNGKDIYTDSKKNRSLRPKKTHVYAKIVDEAKRTAANKIKLDM